LTDHPQSSPPAGGGVAVAAADEVVGDSAHDDQVDAVSLAVQMMESRKNEVWMF